MKNVKERLRHTKINVAIIVFGALVALLVLVTRAAHAGTISVAPELLSLLEFCKASVIAFLVATLVLRLSVPFVTRIVEDAEAEQKILLTKTFGFLVYLFAILYVLWRLGVTLENITIFFGLAATGLGFAIRDIVTSYFAWFMLLTKRPFRIGDHIRIGEDEGRVLHIGTFYVILDDSPGRDEDYTRVPNRTFLEKPIINYGRKRFLFKVRVPIGPMKDLPKGVGRRLETLDGALRKAFGKEIAVSLDADKERVVVEVKTYATDYTERDRIRTGIIRAVIAHVRL